ncbi:LysR family transcriptional regulator [Phenylobacterium sp.]|uniref:LysR family transcriptional regulator n=1 Tax=Phenylobacterium sp. TaxID=1871053 RepID=UPI00286AE983|nr:LysR family transcriptional regulator [Phenylobacterium sp.]
MLDRLSDLRLLVLIVDRGSLTLAAREMGLSPGAVSLRLSALERSMGTSLLRRTTRRLQLTEAGDQFYETARRVLAQVDDLHEQICGEQGGLKGAVRVSAPQDLGRSHLAAAIDEFLARNPAVSVSLMLSDTALDLTESGVDIAVRYGRLPDSGLALRRIATHRRFPVASPAYLDRLGRPARPNALVGHNCMTLLRAGGRFDLWPFQVDGAAITVKVSGDRDANDGDLLRRWALEGRGVALKSAWDVADDIAAGRLEPLLTAFCPHDVDLQLVFPPGRGRPRRVTALADHLTVFLRGLDERLNELGLGVP